MDDLISREKAINAISDLNWYHIGENGKLVCGANSTYDKPLFKASDIYNVLNGIPEANKWIPVSERLPEEYNHVLCQFCMGGIAECYYAHNFFHVVGGLRVNSDEVIAWQPLPQPYKAESED